MPAITISAKHVVRILLSLVSVLLALVIGIAGYRLFYVRKRNTEHIRLGKTSYIFSRVGLFRHFYEPKSDSVVHNTYEGLPYTGNAVINGDTLNAPVNYVISKAPDVYRILTLGDSFTYGLFVDTAKNYPEQLKHLLTNYPCQTRKNVEVINLGVPGYDIGFAAERYVKRGAKYNPDLVIWLLTPSNFMVYTDYEIALEQRLTSEDLTSGVGGAGQPFDVMGSRAMQETIMRVGMERTIGIEVRFLQEFRNYYRGPLVVIVYNGDAWQKEAINAVVQYARVRPQTSLFMMPELPSDSLLLPDHHPNPTGYKRIASDIETYLAVHGIGACQ